jgi:hypothetical protein
MFKNHLKTTQDGLANLLKLVKEELEKVNARKKANKSDAKADEQEVDNNNNAFKELYELTQRKFLKQITQFSEKMSTPKPYPVLFCVDFIGFGEEDTKNDLVPCIKPMCEYEEGWHMAESYIKLADMNINFCAYLTRVMSLIKNGSLSTTLQIFLCEQGQKLLDEIEKNSNSSNIEIRESYIALRKHFVNEHTKSTDLNRCELKNGKTMWLCEKHATLTNAKIITDDLKTIVTNNSDRLQTKLLENIHSQSLEQIDL